MSVIEKVLLIAAAVLGVALTRFLPFLCFSPNKPPPSFVRYLSAWLAPAVFGLLMVYCFRLPLSGGPHGLPMLLATFVTAAAQALWRKMMLSLLLGTGSYLLFVSWLST